MGSAITFSKKLLHACARSSAAWIVSHDWAEMSLRCWHPPVDDQRAVALAQEVVALLEAPIIYQEQPLDVGGSIGIAFYPRHGSDSQALVRNADIAMYVAKRNRSGYSVYEPSYDTSQQEHLSLLSELRRAVECGELCLYYQPKVTLPSSTVTAAEALIRWAHPTRGLVPPALFIPFAEHTGYIKSLTRWVLGEAIRQCGEWRLQGAGAAGIGEHFGT